MSSVFGSVFSGSTEFAKPPKGNSIEGAACCIKYPLDGADVAQKSPTRWAGIIRQLTIMTNQAF